MATNGLTALLRDFRLTLPEGANPTAPLVVVLGWYGCADKHLSKYASLLEKHGYPSLRGVLPGHAVFSPFAFPRRRWAARLLDAVAAVDPEGQRPVVLFAFSNGGAFVVEQVDQLVRDDPKYRPLASRIAGLAFDSAPCYMSLRVGATAIGHGMPLPLRILAALLFFLSVLVMTPFEPLRPWVYWRNMRQLQLGRRSLYLFSEDDPLCLPDKLEQLIGARRAAGADVQVVKWERSQHCGHLLKHYKQYSAALFGFLASLAA